MISSTVIMLIVVYCVAFHVAIFPLNHANTTKLDLKSFSCLTV